MVVFLEQPRVDMLLLLSSLAALSLGFPVTNESPSLLATSKLSLDISTGSSSASTALSASSLRLLYQNDLYASSTYLHASALLTGALSSDAGKAQCASLSEKPLPFSELAAHSSDFLAQFNYLCYEGLLSCPTAVWIDGGAITVGSEATSFSMLPASRFSGKSLPQLCTQSDNAGSDSDSKPSATNEVTVNGNRGNSYLGYRNKKAFRFLGIPYSNTPARFEYSTVNSATNTKFDATKYGSECMQVRSTGASEHCLYLNIHTPYLPASDAKASLRPVMLYIHGGAFIRGTGASSSLSGDNMASREDIVMVTINYRLSTYGFMAIPGSTISGNYGISDMVSALDWLVANIASFGGDASQITIVGQSAGAAAVRILLGSPKAIGKYQRAIIMSNLGGGVDLGEAGDYGSSNSQYYTVGQSYDVAGRNVLAEAKCTQSSLAGQVACLKAYPGDLTSLSSASRFPVQDGTYIDTPRLEAGQKGSKVAHVPVMMGNTKNDGGSFVGYSKTCTSAADCIASNLAISKSQAEDILNSGHFTMNNSGDLHFDAFNMSQRVRTDDTFRCIDQATAYAAVSSGSTGPVYYYQVMRSFGGFNPDDVDAVGPVSSAFPAGDPNLAYYRLHSGELAFALGTQATFRDDEDYEYLQLMTAYWASFVRTGNPNPNQSLLKARGYTTTLGAVEQIGTWSPVSGRSGPVMELDYPWASLGIFNEVAQCNWLNYTLDHFLS